MNKLFAPKGFMLYNYCGDKKTKRGKQYQSVFHFHLHIVPIYRKNCGFNWLPTKLLRAKPKPGETEELIPSSQEYQEAKQELETKPGIVCERSKVIAQLASQDEALIQGHIIIKPKKSIPNDINAIDEQTWAEMGELLQECIQKTKKKIETRHSSFHIGLGKWSGPSQESFTEFQLHFVPYKDNAISHKDSLLPTNPAGANARDYMRIAEKIRDADKLPPKKPKTERHEIMIQR